MDGISRAFAVVSLVLVLVMGGSDVARAELLSLTYDPSLGTLPELQGWAKSVTGSAADQGVGSGAFMQIASASNSTTSYQTRHGNFDFSSSIATSLETSLLVKQSAYVPLVDRWQAGYTLAMTDSLDRHFILGIAQNGVRLTNDASGANANSSVFLPMDLKTGWHDFRMVARDGFVELFIDRQKMLELEVGASLTLPSLTNSFRFGDMSPLATSATSTKYVSAVAVPEPGSLVLFAGMLGLALGCWQWRRRA
jgi:hypothetical protein